MPIQVGQALPNATLYEFFDEETFPAAVLGPPVRLERCGVISVTSRAIKY